MSRRGTSNSNARGNTRDRAARKHWLLKTWRAVFSDKTETGIAYCRCWRCGALLPFSEITVDRIVPGCRGGTYRRNNIRPACAGCNSETGGATRRAA